MRKIIITIFLILFCLFLYGHYVEVNNFKTNEYVIKNADIPASFTELKIIHFSDLLLNNNYNKKNLENLVQKINELDGDILIFSGDLLNKNNSFNDEELEEIKNYLKEMQVSLYKYAVVGDNDESYLDKYVDLMYDADFKLLNNENMLLFYKNLIPINIIGITDVNKIEELLQTDEEYDYSLVITHKPDNIITLSNYDVDTILCGHSLGGIINIPYYGGAIKKEGAETYINGHYQLNNTNMFISNGLGYENFNFRLLNTPSINVYRLEN